MEYAVKKISVWDIVPIEFAELILEFILIGTVIEAVRFPKKREIKIQVEDLPEKAKKEIQDFVKKFDSPAVMAYDGKRNSRNAFDNFTRGWRIIGKKRYFYKSIWEMNFARYLQYLKKHREIKDWYYEPDTFWFDKIKRGVRSYKPDFKTVDFDGEIIYYEVKGFLDNKSVTKISRMRKYYPNVRLIVIDSKWFNTKGKHYSVLINGWEKKTIKVA
jgi:hypothetical protein